MTNSIELSNERKEELEDIQQLFDVNLTHLFLFRKKTYCSR